MLHVKKKFYAVLWLLALAPALLWAQSRGEFDLKYQNGKTLLEQKKYERAMAEFLPLANASPENTHAPEAAYFYALAAIQANKLHEAGLMLQHLLSEHPDWLNRQEALYLQADIAFREKDYDRALGLMQQINTPALLIDKQAMKRAYLGQVNDKMQFRYLLQQYPEDETLARVYADKLVAGWYTDADRPQLEQLVSKFRLDRKRYLDSGSMFKKQEYNVAVLFPFGVSNSGSVEFNRKNQFITDLYAGMLLAQDSLQQQNIKINLFTYDTGSDTAQVRKMMEMPEIAGMDLIIGPIYKTTSRLASKYARDHQVNIINPLTEDLELAENNPYLFLFESSTITKAKEAARFAFERFEPKTAVIVYDNTRDDTIFASTYRQEFMRLGGKVKSYKKIDTKKTPNTTAFFTALDITEAGHLVVASNAMTAAANTVSLLESKNPKLPLLTYASWLDINQISLQTFDELEAYFIHPKYINSTAPEVKNFRRNYTARFNIPPSVYAYNGFEMLYFFGNLLQRHGTRFNNSLATEPFRPGVFYPGFRYNNPKKQTDRPYTNDNQFVPVFKLEDRQMILQNPVLE